MLDIFVLEEDYFQQARLEDAIHKSKQIYILRIGRLIYTINPINY